MPDVLELNVGAKAAATAVKYYKVGQKFTHPHYPDCFIFLQMTGPFEMQLAVMGGNNLGYVWSYQKFQAVKGIHPVAISVASINEGYPGLTPVE